MAAMNAAAIPATFKFSSEMESLLIELVHERRSLWDHKHPNYTKSTLKGKMYGDIAAEMRQRWPQATFLTAESVKKKFRNMRTYYVKESNKIRSLPGGSAGVPFTSRWAYYSQMAFLEEVNEAEKSLTNIPTTMALEDNLNYSLDDSFAIVEDLENLAPAAPQWMEKSQPLSKRTKKNDPTSKISMAIDLAHKALTEK